MRLASLWPGRAARSQREERLPVGHRVYAIGDIHGCNALLVRLLDAIARDIVANPAAHVTLVYLGDYIDRGPQSADVISLVAQPLKGVDDTIRLKGNHEEMLERFLADPSYGSAWRQFGGLATLASYGVDVRAVQAGRDYDMAARALFQAMPASHSALVEALTYSYVKGGYFFCHAGVRPGVALEQQQPSDLCWIRHEFLASTEKFGKVVVHGHSPVESPEVLPNRINVDTGAYATGKLSCAVLEGDSVEFLQT